MSPQDTLLHILDQARWAPSGDNTQPWRFELAAPDHVVVHASDTRADTVYDLDGHPSQISVGALLETIAIAASAHWQAPHFVQLMKLLRVGDLPEARRVWQALSPWVEACFAEPNPAPLKAVLAQAGWMRNELRAPIMAASAAMEQRLEATLGTLTESLGR